MLALLATVSLACAGCSWLIGVSEDPVVVEEPGNDAGAAYDTGDAGSAADRQIVQDAPSEAAEAEAGDAATDGNAE